MATEFGTGKSIFILAIVLGCFAILWPKIFYPMLQDTVTVKPNIISSQDCCDVFFEKDLNAIKIMTDVCEKILRNQNDYNQQFMLSFQQGKLTKEIVNRCKNEVLSKCDVDITSFLLDKVRLGKTYKQILDEIRSLNSSLCLKQNFGVAPGLIGAPRRMRIWQISTSKHLRQERPPHLRPDLMHPALKEKGRAITVPPAHIVPKVQEKETPGRPMPPMPGMRPPMGGAGHVVPAPKGSGTMGIIMPLYTIGIVIFFMYTMMKLIFKKSDDSSGYKDLEPDPEFRRVVFNDADYHRTNLRNAHKETDDNNSKLVMTAISGLVAEVNRDILSKQDTAEVQQTEPAAAQSVEDASKKEITPQVEEEITAKVQVVGMEMTESIEGGQRWSRPSTPLSRCATPLPIPEPQNIFLEGSLPSQSQLLVSQSETQTLPPSDDEASVILAGKVTLSLIGFDAGIKPELEDSAKKSVDNKDKVEMEDEEEEIEDKIEPEEEELYDEHEVSGDEAEVEDGVNGDEDATTNYTTASGIGVDETGADVSLVDNLAQDLLAQDEDYDLEEEDEELEKGVINGQTIEYEDEDELEEEEVEEEEEEEDEEEEEPPTGQPQSSQHQR